jgi:hypothetical protein
MFSISPPKRRLITANPAEGLRPIKRDTLSPSEKRRPFSLEQIADFFRSPFYAESAKHAPPFSYDNKGWRFWLPPMCLFMGMRPNEAAQMHVDDLKRTEKGTWYCTSSRPTMRTPTASSFPCSRDFLRYNPDGVYFV